MAANRLLLRELASTDIDVIEDSLGDRAVQDRGLGPTSSNEAALNCCRDLPWWEKTFCHGVDDRLRGLHGDDRESD